MTVPKAEFPDTTHPKNFPRLVSVSSELNKRANQIRSDICKMCLAADSGHPTSSLSCADIVATLFFSEMNCSPEIKPEQRDLFYLSKGHAAPALYAALIAMGFLSKDFLTSLRKMDSPLQGHPDVNRFREVNATTGALGQGLSMAIGRAIGVRMKGQKRWVYCVIGDGESQEGQIWEAALFGGNRDVRNLIAFTDFNKGQSDGSLDEIMPLGDLAKKWEAFNWSVREIDGHDTFAIQKAIREAKQKKDSRPTMIIAHTVKGYIGPNYSILEGDHSGKITKNLFYEVEKFLGNKC